MNAVQPRNNADSHVLIQDLLGAYALGGVSDDERRAIEDHLEHCDLCRAELDHLMLAVRAYPLAVSEREPPPDLRNRIRALALTEAEIDQPVRPASHGLRRFSVSSARWALPLAAVLLSALIGMGIWNVWLQQRLDRDTPESIGLERSDPSDTWSGQLTYLADEQVAVLQFRDMPTLPSGQVYQIWLIAGETPVPAGIFTGPDARQAVAADIRAFQAIAITVESGPLGSPAPTTEPISVTSLPPG